MYHTLKAQHSLPEVVNVVDHKNGRSPWEMYPPNIREAKDAPF